MVGRYKTDKMKGVNYNEGSPYHKMENNINNKKNNYNMKGLILSLLVLFMLPFAFSVAQSEIIEYQFEEGSGSIVLDTSGNNNHGTVIGATWDGTNPKYGLYAMEFDGNADYITSIANLGQTPENFAMSFWVKPDADTTITNFYSVESTLTGNQTHRVYYDFSGTNLLYIDYINELNNTETINISYALVEDGNTWTHLVFNYYGIDDRIEVYADKILIYNESQPNGIVTSNSTDRVIRLAVDSDLNGEYNGEIDVFRGFDDILDFPQIDQLFSTNTVILRTDGEEPEIPITGVEQSNIIGTYAPVDNSSHYNPVTFEATLLLQASCDLYIDNSYYTSYTDILAFNDDISLGVGEHTYFIYCSLIQDDTQYFDKTDITTFTVLENEPGTVTFTITGTDFDISTKNLYLTSPCLKEGMYIWSVSQPYSATGNPEGAYFRQLSDGFTSFTVPSGVHEFCLFHGSIDYITYNKTADYYIGKAYNNLNIGKYQIPNNLTTSYAISVDNFDIYGKTNPKAWGQTWITIIGSLLAFAIGLGLAYVGVENKEPKLVLVGALLIALSLGYQLGNLILGVLV